MVHAHPLGSVGGPWIGRVGRDPGTSMTLSGVTTAPLLLLEATE
jgi:hypothetical protein